MTDTRHDRWSTDCAWALGQLEPDESLALKLRCSGLGARQIALRLQIDVGRLMALLDTAEARFHEALDSRQRRAPT